MPHQRNPIPSFYTLSRWSHSGERMHTRAVMENLTREHGVQFEKRALALISRVQEDRCVEPANFSLVRATTAGIIESKSIFPFDAIEEYAAREQLTYPTITDGLFAIEQFIRLGIEGRMVICHQPVAQRYADSVPPRKMVRLFYRPSEGNRRVTVIPVNDFAYRFKYLYQTL